MLAANNLQTESNAEFSLSYKSGRLEGAKNLPRCEEF
jgi:hypothetical protein